MTFLEELNEAINAPEKSAILTIINRILDEGKQENIDILKKLCINTTLNGSDNVTIPLIILVIIHNDLPTLSKMIEHQFDCNYPITQWNKENVWVTPLMFACKYQLLVIVKLLLDQNVSFAGYSEKKLGLFEIAAIYSSRNIVEILLKFTISQNKIKELLSVTNEYQDTVQQVYNPHHILNSILAIIFTPSFKTCMTLEDLKIFAASTHEYLSKAHPLINYSQINTRSVSFFRNENNKVTHINNALTVYTNLLDNLPQCYKLLQKLESVLADEIKRNYPANTLHNLNSDNYTLVEHYGMHWPLPKELSQPIKLNSLLSRAILHEMQRFDLGRSSYKWYGFLKADIANEHVAHGEYFTEDTLDIGGLLHGKYSHAIQLLILVYAVEEGLISLEYTNGLKLKISDLLLALVTKNENQEMPWTTLNDTLYTLNPSFSAPHFFHSTLLVHGEKEGLPLLGSTLKNSFFKALKRSMNFYNTYYNGGFTCITDFWNNLVLLNEMVNFRTQEISNHFFKRSPNSARSEKLIATGTLAHYTSESYIVTEKSFIKS